MEPDQATFASRLDHLFRAVHPRNRGEYTHEEVSKAIRDAGGPTISGSYIWQLRKGIKDNPTKRHIEALATFFGVPANYFFDDADQDEIAQQLDLLVALRDSNVRNVALRAGQLTDKGRDAVMALIEALSETTAATDPKMRDDGSDDG